MARYLYNDFYIDSWEGQQQNGVCQGQSVLVPVCDSRKNATVNLTFEIYFRHSQNNWF